MLITSRIKSKLGFLSLYHLLNLLASSLTIHVLALTLQK